MSFTTLPTIETFGNNDITSLSSPMGVPDTTISVASVAGFPTDGQFRLLIDSELLLVTAYDPVANEWQVVRGIENTTATTHEVSAQVICILTRGGLLQLKTDAQANGGNTFVYRANESNPTGNVYTSFDAAYNAAAGTNVPATIVFDDSLGDCLIAPLLSGSNAGFSAFSDNLLTVTGLTGMTPDMVGQSLVIFGAANSTNNGVFAISSFISDTSVQITNSSGVYPDSNSGSISWALSLDYDLSQMTLSGLTPGAFQEPTTIVGVEDGVTFNEGYARITGGLWLVSNFNVQPYFGSLTTASTYYMRIDESGMMTGDNEGAGFDVSQENNPVVFMVMDDGASVLSQGSCGPYFYTGNGSPNVHLQMGDATYIDDGFIAGNDGNLSLRVNSLSAQVPTNIDFGGSINSTFGAYASNLEPYAGSGAFPIPQLAPNITTGTMYYDEGTNQPYWWNGSEWVTYAAPPSVTITGTPTTGQVPTATSGTTAIWQTPINIFIYAGGSTPSGNIYNTFDTAYAAAVAGGLPAIIGIDDRVAACTVSTNADFNLSQITLTGGFGPNPNTLTVQAGTWNEGFAKITNGLNVVVSLATPTTALITISGPTFSQNAYVENSSSVFVNQGRVWDLSTGSGFINLNLYVGDLCSVSGNGDRGQAIWTGDVGSTTIYLGGSPTCTLSSDALAGSSTATIVVGTGAIYPNTLPLPYFTGSLNFIYGGRAANLVPYTGSGTFPTSGSNPNVQIGTMYWDQTSGAPWWWNGTAWVTTASNSGVELLTATPGSSQGTPVGNLSLSVQVSILVNTTGGSAFWHLPDGTDGTIKEIVSGGNYGSSLISNGFIAVTSTNNAYGTNDLLDLNGSGYSVRLVWSTAGGGWVAVSTCTNASALWD